MEGISPQLQNQIAQFQQLQQQLQTVMAQRYQMEAQLKEMERTVEELDKAPEDATVYRNVGALLIKAKDKETVKSDIEENHETLGIRIKAMERQEKQMQERYQGLQQTISQAMNQPQGA